jgi:hypothetical protein
VNFIKFKNFEEMQAYLIQAQADADSHVTPAQRAIGYGDYWARFIDVGNRIVEFGRVYTLTEVRRLEVEAGATAQEADFAVSDTEQSMKNGNFLYGRAASILLPNGESGYTHKANVWPIEESLWAAAAECGWNIDVLPLSAKVNLEAAFIAYRGRAK